MPWPKTCAGFAIGKSGVQLDEASYGSMDRAQKKMSPCGECVDAFISSNIVSNASMHMNAKVV